LANERSRSSTQRFSDNRDDEESPRGRKRRFIPRRKVCTFCTDKVEVIDYKQPELLRRFLTDRGKIRPRRRTGTCAKHQRRLATAIKRARHLALLPYVAEHLRHYS
jgi:small subunit ribosomal protein S18